MVKMIGGVRGVSHVEGDGRGEGASAIFKVMGGRVRGVSHGKGDGRGGGERRQPCSW